MYLSPHHYLQTILVYTLYFSMIVSTLSAADHNNRHNGPRGANNNNNIFLLIEHLSDVTKNTAPSITIKYSTQIFNSAGYLYSTETIHQLNHFTSSFRSLTVEKMKAAEVSSITFLAYNSKEKENSVKVNDYDTLLISSIHENPIIIKKKNGITNQIVEVARFNLK